MPKQKESMAVAVPEVEQSPAPQVYEIPAVNFPRLEAEIKKLNRRAEKLKCSPITLRVIEKRNVNRKDDTLELDYTEGVFLCTVEGEPPKLEGWTLIAILEPVRNGEMLVREVPGQICPKRFRTTDLRCDHCQQLRRRNAVYVLWHEVHGYSQVGRQCLADFLGHANPEHMLGAAQYLMDFVKLASDAEEDGWGRMGSGKLPLMIPIHHFVAVVAVVVRKAGWIPRSQKDEEHQPTADICWDICVNPHYDYIRQFISKHALVAEQRDVQLATDALAWAAAIDPDTAQGTYLHNLGVSCRQEFVEWKVPGFVGSVITAYQRHIEQEERRRQEELAQREKKPSEHLGEVGNRYIFEDVKIVNAKVIQGDIYTSTLTKFVDPQGNVLIWFASGTPDWIDKGKTVTIRGTVKKHDHYQGVAQTTLSRVSLEKDDENYDPDEEVGDNH